MNKVSKEQLEKFKHLNYEQKLVFLDTHSCLIPFDFPLYDIEASWYQNELKASDLIAIFTKETRNKNLYEHVFSVEGQEYRLDVRPASGAQRYFLNKFILNKFFRSIEDVRRELKDHPKSADPTKRWLQARINYFSRIVEWVQQTLQNSTHPGLRTKLLEVFYHGYQSFHYGNEHFLRIRRRFVELFLYSQGLLLAQHLLDLKKHLETPPRIKHPDEPFDLPLKMVLLQQLGVLDLLRSRYAQKDPSRYEQALAELLSLLFGANIQNRRTLEQHIRHLNSGSASDLLTETNIRTVQKVLQKLNWAEDASPKEEYGSS